MTTLSRRTSARHAALLAGLAALLVPHRSGLAIFHHGVVEPVVVYTPVEDDFRPEYDRDKVNSRVQSWGHYWGWVKSFYRGNLLSAGWIKETHASLAVVADPEARRKLATSLNNGGKVVGREWAKDNSARKITTSDLTAWGNRLDAARRSDLGDGARLLAAVEKIDAEAKAKLAGKRSAAPRRAVH